MKILILTWRDLHHPAAGGAEVYTEEVAKRWVSAGHEVTLFAATAAGRPAEEVVDGYQVIRRGNRFTVYRDGRTWWRQSGSRMGFDVVLDMINTVAFSAHKWIEDVPTVAFAHQTCEEIWHVNAPRPADYVGRYILEPHWLRGYRDVPTLAVSQSTKDALARFGMRDITVVPEGFAPPHRPPAVIKEDCPTLVWCARQVSYKRPYDLLQAAAALSERIPDLAVWMLGGGPELERVRAAAPSNVEVLGRVDESEKIERMAGAHLHVSTSVREGWGLVVSEAAALGTPTLAYDVPGLRDSTRAAGGTLCPPHPDALVAWLPSALSRAMTTPMAPLPYGGAHSWDTVAEVVLAEMVRAAGLNASRADAVSA
ncbi:MAG: glycosyltransferase family 4 protein [Candidatus Nanopelagicales bacterium]